MCCNASNSIDSPWTEIKYDVLKKTKDITCIWNINYEHRNKIFDLNINNYSQLRESFKASIIFAEIIL